MGVAIRGRDGVGKRSVAAALAGAGVTLASGDVADIDVVVIAEALKPEDTALLTAAGRPVLAVLNKADLLGGPIAVAHRRAAECRARTGVPTVPMIAPLAQAVIDDELLAALRVLTGEPADLTSTDAFVDGGHLVPRRVRARLLETLDRFGIAHAVLALARGAEPSSLTALLRRLSAVDDVVAALDRTAAPVRYRRVYEALSQVQMAAARSGDRRLLDFLAADGTVLAVMSAAVDVVEATGLAVDRGDDTAAHVRRARHWRGYSRGPVNAVHRRCGDDICRGSLRLLSRVRGGAP